MSTATQTQTQAGPAAGPRIDRPTATTTRQIGSPGGSQLPVLEDVRPLSFGRLLRTELRKMIDTRTGRWLLLGIVAITAITLGAVLWMNRQDGADLGSLLLAANIPQGVLLPVLGIMTAANEWGQRTALITFTQEPRRLRVMTAKTLAAVLLGLAVLAVCGLLAALAHVVSMSLAGGTIDLAIPLHVLVGLVVVQVVGVLWGVAFGAALLNVPLAIVAFFLVPALSPLVFRLTAWLRENGAWFDLSGAQLPIIGDAWPTATEWAQLGTATALWVVLPLAIGLWRVSHREVR